MPDHELALPLLEAIEARVRSLGGPFERLRWWLYRTSRPPAAVEIRTTDGSCWSGVMVVQANRLVIAWCARVPPLHTPPDPYRAPPPSPFPTYPRRYEADEDDPRSPYFYRDR